eukprot:6512839-Alexandrium_andersonii.AAC.1
MTPQPARPGLAEPGRRHPTPTAGPAGWSPPSPRATPTPAGWLEGPREGGGVERSRAMPPSEAGEGSIRGDPRGY